jgi:hypothetical protein
MDYTIITAWYDLREEENHPDKDDKTDKYFCSMDWYFESAKKLFNKPFPIVIFTEPRFKEYILSVRPIEFHSKTHFIFREYKDLTNYDIFEKFEENHSKSPIHNVTKEKFTALYKFIVNQKVNFVKEVIEGNPFNSVQFAWMDMRLHCVYDMGIDETNVIMDELPDNQVRLMQMSYTDPVNDRRDFYAWTRGKVAAGFFGGYKEPLLQFCNLCQKEFLEAIAQDTAPSDEMIYSYVISHNPALFDLYVGEYSDCLKNQLAIRNSLHLVLQFLHTSYERGNDNYIIALSNRIMRGFNKYGLQLSCEQIHDVWFYSYISHNSIGNFDTCLNIINEYFEISKNRPDVTEYIRNNRYIIYDKLHDNSLKERLLAI